MKKRGFTLIELLVVVAIIAILAAAVFVAINPARRIAEANNAQRWSDVIAVLNAVLTYVVDNDGDYPPGIDSVPGTYQVLGTNGNGCNSDCGAVTTVSACTDLTAVLVSNGYIPSIPMDPKTGNSGNTDYYINKESTGVITVGACDPDDEGDNPITMEVAR